MNEISVQITYFHKKNSWLNITNLKLKMPPYISHGKFHTMRKTLDFYEKFCRSNFIKQIPSLLRQNTMKAKEVVKEVIHHESGNLETDQS